MFRGILPREYAFFDYFDELIKTDREISSLFLSMMNSNGNRVELSRQIQDLEKQSDRITHTCTDLLHNTFITPIERNDIFTLIKRLDNIADHINAAAFRIASYGITEIRPEAEEFSKIILACVEELVVAIQGLRKIKNTHEIRNCCKKIHDLENQADDVLRNGVHRLFKEGEVMTLIKWKEIFERLEKAVDKCEDVASTIEGILIENS